MNTEAATAVLQFSTQARAQEASDQLAGWVSDCDRGMEGTRPVSLRHDPVVGNTGHGPSIWRVVESPAPEFCTECDTGWIDAQGVALAGNRVALLSIAYTGTMTSGADTAGNPMGRGIQHLADLAAGGPGR